MKIIVPMAGRGSRLRPHTLTVPKPLIPIAGKPIVQRLVEDIAKDTLQKWFYQKVYTTPTYLNKFPKKQQPSKRWGQSGFLHYKRD